MSVVRASGVTRRPLRIVDARDPLAVRDAIAEALAGGPPVLPRQGGLDTAPDDVRALGLDDTWPVDACLVIETSGSTAAPKRVVLTASALRASAAATVRRLDELAVADGRAPGAAHAQWLLCLPTDYVAGAQVLARSIAAGTEPMLAPPGAFDPTRIAEAVERMGPGWRLTSFVPAQLIRLLDAAESAITDPTSAPAPDDEPELARRVRDAIASFDAILVGGQSTPLHVRDRAAALGWRLVTTYGASETAGGCVYNCVPLDGVDAHAADGELWLRGDVLAAGYLGDPERTRDRFVPGDDGRRWYRTGDAGTVSPPGAGAPPWARQTIAVTGRLDNVIISGGEKVLLDRVERVVRDVPGYGDAVVVGVPDVRWGEVPAVAVVGAVDDSAGPSGEAADPPDRLAADTTWARLRETVAQSSGRAARPAHRIRLPELPRLTSGKPDRRAIADLARAAVRARDGLA